MFVAPVRENRLENMLFALALTSFVASVLSQGYNAPPFRPSGGNGASFGSSSNGNFGFGGSYSNGIGQSVVPILSDERHGPIDGVYSFSFETGDGISRHEEGSPDGPDGAVVQQGGWEFTFPDGTPAQFSFIADENGYRVESPLLPTPPPMPAHALAQIEKAKLEDAASSGNGGYGNGFNQRPSVSQQSSQQFNSYQSPGGFQNQHSNIGGFQPQASGFQSNGYQAPENFQQNSVFLSQNGQHAQSSSYQNQNGFQQQQQHSNSYSNGNSQNRRKNGNGRSRSKSKSNGNGFNNRKNSFFGQQSSQQQSYQAPPQSYVFPQRNFK